MIKVLNVLLWCFMWHTALMAQAPEEKAVTEAVENLREAMLNADQAALEKLTADALSYGHSSGKIEDKKAFVEALVSGQSDFKSINLTEQTVQLAGDNAIVRHKLTGNVVDGGKAADVKLGILLVWQKQQGTWKLLARQAFKL